jgi:hypothetical protein
VWATNAYGGDSRTWALTLGGNTAPVASNASATIWHDPVLYIPAAFADPDPQTFTVSVVGWPAHGAVRISGNGFIYTPEPGYGGTDSFAWQVSDGLATSGTATVSVTIEGSDAALTFQTGNGGYSGCQDSFVSLGGYADDYGVNFGLNRFLLLNSDHYRKG